MEFPTKAKCVHTVAIDGWRPDLCEITIPNLKRYAARIGADFNLISKPKFPGYPPNYERLQVWEAGREYMWNICLDADTILHRDFEDPTEWMSKYECGSLWMTDAKYYFETNKYFMRDGRNIGVADCFVVSSWFTHDIWRPLDIPFEEARKLCFKNERMVSEYCLSLNVAKFGLKYNGVAKDHSKHFSPMVTTHKVADPVAVFKKKLAEWNEI